MIRFNPPILIALLCSTLGHGALFLFMGGEKDTQLFQVQLSEQISSVRVEIVSVPTPKPPSPATTAQTLPNQPVLTTKDSPKAIQQVVPPKEPAYTPEPSPLPQPPPVETPPSEVAAPPQAVETPPTPSTENPPKEASPITEQAAQPPLLSKEQNGAFTQKTAKAIHCPSPNYPTRAREKKMEGLVLLSVTIEADGSVSTIEILKSSGHRLLDKAARRTIRKKWRFTPSSQNHEAVRSVLEVEVSFRLNH